MQCCLNTCNTSFLVECKIPIQKVTKIWLLPNGVFILGWDFLLFWFCLFVFLHWKCQSNYCLKPNFQKFSANFMGYSCKLYVQTFFSLFKVAMLNHTWIVCLKLCWRPFSMLRKLQLVEYLGWMFGRVGVWVGVHLALSIYTNSIQECSSLKKEFFKPLNTWLLVIFLRDSFQTFSKSAWRTVSLDV